MIDTKGLKTFLAIIEHKSFERAAHALFITQSGVSQRLKALEESIGQSLVIRTPSIKATIAGQALLKYAQNLAQIERSLTSDLAPRKQLDWLKVSIATNADTLSTWLPDALAPWCLKHKVLLSLKVDDQDQTHQLLRSGEVLGCISALEQPAYGCSSTSLGSVKYHCIASPAFIKQYFSKGVSKKSIAKAPTVLFNSKDQLQHQYLQTFFDLDANQQLKHFIPSSESYLQWIILGMGFGMAPKQQINSLLKDKKLQLVTPDHSINVPLYWQQWGVKTDLSNSLTEQIIKYAHLAHR